MSEAQLGSALVRGVEQVYTFDEPLAMSAVISSQEQREDFKAWLSHFRGSEEYAMLNDLYFERGIVGPGDGPGPDRQECGRHLVVRRPVPPTCARRRAMTGA